MLIKLPSLSTSISAIQGGVPWWIRIGAKLILSRLPLSSDHWRRIGIFRHGKMDQPDYSVSSFERHLSRLGLCTDDIGGRVVMELGPGDSIATAIIASAYGARAILVDVGHFALTDISTYLNLSDYLTKIGGSPPDISSAKSLQDILQACNGQYLTGGLNSLYGIQNETVDFVISQAVLEHIRRHEFLASILESYRILKVGGFCSHSVDLKDHLGGGLNNLRFSHQVWESSIFSSSGFYTNRIQMSDMLTSFKVAGFEVINLVCERWDHMPINKSNLSRDFISVSADDLTINSFDVILKKLDESKGNVEKVTGQLMTDVPLKCQANT